MDGLLTFQLALASQSVVLTSRKRALVQASTLLRILPPEKPKEPPASHASEAGPSRRKRGKQASESISLSEESGPKKGKASLAAICSEEPVPEWCPAATEQARTGRQDALCFRLCLCSVVN